MSSQLSSRLGSSITELTAQAGQASFFVHTNLLTLQSPSLEATIKAGQKLHLQSWDSDTVGHLVNFLYLGTYSVLSPTPHRPTEAPYDSDTTASISRVHTPDTKRTAPHDYSFKIQRAALCVTPDNDMDCTSAKELTESDYYLHHPQETHNYHDVLFTHVRVYALAQFLSIDQLCKLTYRRLSMILAGLNLIAPRSALATSVVELLDHVYTHIKPRGDLMRKLVSQFVALNSRRYGAR